MRKQKILNLFLSIKIIFLKFEKISFNIENPELIFILNLGFFRNYSKSN